MSHIALAVVGCGFFPALMRLTPAEFAAVGIALLFAGHQIADLWRSDKQNLRWTAGGALLYVILAWLCRFALDTLVESGIFLLLVAVNIAIAFLPRFRVWSATVFLDVTLCFILSHLIIPGRIVFRGFVGGRPSAWFPLPVFFRDPAAIIVNLATLIMILTAYWIAHRERILTNPCGTRGAARP